jgi:type II secretion system protein C
MLLFRLWCLVSLLMGSPLLASPLPASPPPPEGFLVLGVIATQDPAVLKGVALFKNQQTLKTFAIKEGDTFDENSQLIRVAHKTVTVKLRGSLYTLRVGDDTLSALNNKSSARPQGVASTQGIEVNEGSVKVTAAYKQHIITDKLETVLMQAASEPFYESGKLCGFTLLEIEKDSIYETVGLKNGDIITSINDHELNDLGSTLRLLTSLKNEDEASFKFRRDGLEQSIRIMVQ